MHSTKTLYIPPLHPSGKGYRIIFETHKSSPHKNAVPEEDWKHFENLYVNIQEEPKKHIESLKQFYDQYPDVPEVANLLAFALLKTKKRKAGSIRGRTKNSFLLPIIVEKDDGGYFATCPSLQGCYTQGDTYEEVLANIEDAVRLHIEDRLANGEQVPQGDFVSLTALEVTL